MSVVYHSKSFFLRGQKVSITISRTREDRVTFIGYVMCSQIDEIENSSPHMYKILKIKERKELDGTIKWISGLHFQIISEPDEESIKIIEDYERENPED